MSQFTRALIASIGLSVALLTTFGLGYDNGVKTCKNIVMEQIINRENEEPKEKEQES